MLAIVPARGGSKGIPGKNLAEVGGTPMVARAVLCGREAGLPVLISSDDPTIRQCAIEAGAISGYDRPPELATDTATTLETILHALRWYERAHGEVEAVMVLQPTSPLRRAGDVLRACEAWERRGEARSLISVCRGGHLSLGILYRVAEDGRADVVAGSASFQRHDQRPLFVRNGAIYISETSLVAEGRLLCERPLALEMPRERSVNVDEPFDLHIARLLEERPFEG